MGVGMTKVLHVKIPVTDLQRSAVWYAQLMDLVLTREFIEDGELRGAALHSPEGGFAFALRLREHCSSQPVLDGFDVVALHMATRDALTQLRQRCARLGITCTQIQDRAANEAVVDVADPDGTVLRFYWVAGTSEPGSFTGLIFNCDAPPQLTTEPRLHAPQVARRH
jgi:catechol 2,3-dioxygenase-like lactoylglutathione lyase family enzyme